MQERQHSTLGKEHIEHIVSRQFRDATGFQWDIKGVTFEHNGSLENIGVQTVIEENLMLRGKLDEAKAVIANNNLLLMEAING